ncbi:MAG: hypothetical protein F6K58_22940 [Symploca sp. SIO2E9]|nr:hypothetical protein [Symploca sp. SIO2E9]
MLITCSCSQEGLDNRRLALSFALALSKLLHTKIAFSSKKNYYCPSWFYALFKDMPGLLVNHQDTTDQELLRRKLNLWQ